MTKEFIAKLAAACDAVGGIEKKGKNPVQGYAYLRATDVTKAFRHELFERGIVITQNECAPEYIEYQTAKGNRGLDCRIAIEFTITDGDSSITGIGHGHAMDTSDKPLYKAKTGALKYFLRGLGLIPDEKDDPETDSPSAEFDKEKYVAQKKAELSPKDDSYEWRQRIAQCSTPAEFNSLFPDAHKAPADIKKWIMEKANSCGFAYDKKIFAFYDPKEKLTEQLEGALEVTPEDENSVTQQAKAAQAKLDSRKQVSKSEEIAIHQARKNSKIGEREYYNILGKYGAEHAKELQKANFVQVLQEINEHIKGE